MATLRIYDCDGRVLAVDLRHLIDLLAPRSLQATWTASSVEGEELWATGQGGVQLEGLARNRSPVSGAVLAELAKSTVQVIWGEFTAVLPPQSVVWVTIRAIDSTFYEVTTTDEVVLKKVRSTYKDVRVATGPDE